MTPQDALWYLEAGGRITLRDWAELSLGDRAALAAAGRRLEVHRAVRIGRACQGDLAALRVQAEIDQGVSHDDALLAAAVRGIARGAGGGVGHE